jgi:hypothetical protein
VPHKKIRKYGSDSEDDLFARGSLRGPTAAVEDKKPTIKQVL